MIKTILSSTLILVTVFLISCKAPEKRTPPPRDDQKRMHSGKAVITKITDSRKGTGDDTVGYVDIYFNFVPSDPAAMDRYLCRECPDNNIKLFYDNRESFHANWVKNWNIKPGSEYAAIRHELLRKDNRPSVSHEVFLEPAK